MLNPFLKTEWLQEGRNIRFPLMIIFYNAILAFVMILFMVLNEESFQKGYYYNNSNYVYEFLIISSIHFIAVFLMMPFSVSRLFLADKENNMLDQFMMIPGISKQYVQAKIMLVLSLHGVIFISGLPILTLGCIYTGVSWTIVIRLAIMVLIYSFWAGSIAIFFFSIASKIIWGFVGTLFGQMIFGIGTIIAAGMLCNGSMIMNGGGEVSSSVSNLCLLLLLMNPLASYMGYFGKITGDTGMVSAFCNYMGIDASQKIFSFLFYKAAILTNILVGVAFLVLSVWYMEKRRRN
ncbi:MAG: hypothetical protein PUH88_02535 [Lachnospiraceae bacterium]|nr:hypothetical protein [Lachnospiraceae bacterium]